MASRVKVRIDRIPFLILGHGAHLTLHVEGLGGTLDAGVEGDDTDPQAQAFGEPHSEPLG